MTATPGPVPADIQNALDLFVDSAKAAFSEDLQAVVLFGSAAEGRMRPTSDVNVVVVLARLDPSKAVAHRPAHQAAAAAIRLRPLYLLREEIDGVARLFAQKFSDILRRRRVLFGEDPFSRISIPRDALARRVEQVLSNLSLRLRARAIELDPDDPAAGVAVAEAAGPLRVGAAAIRELEGHPGELPRDALANLLSEMSASGGSLLLEAMTRARAGDRFAPETAATILFDLADLSRSLSERARTLA